MDTRFDRLAFGLARRSLDGGRARRPGSAKYGSSDTRCPKLGILGGGDAIGSRCAAGRKSHSLRHEDRLCAGVHQCVLQAKVEQSAPRLHSSGSSNRVRLASPSFAEHADSTYTKQGQLLKHPLTKWTPARSVLSIALTNKSCSDQAMTSSNPDTCFRQASYSSYTNSLCGGSGGLIVTSRTRASGAGTGK